MSLLLAVLLGVLVLRGVFDETGVFGLNKMLKLDYTMNVTSVDKTLNLHLHRLHYLVLKIFSTIGKNEIIESKISKTQHVRLKILE